MQIPDQKLFKQLTISVEKLPASMDRQTEINNYAAERSRLLLGCYRTGDANDPETYVAAITAVLARYPQEVITSVTHPVNGIVAEIKWLPSVMEVKEACERAFLPIRNQVAREQRIAEQMETRKFEDQAKDRRPTYDELEAKYGENWGLNAGKEKRREPMKAPTAEQLAHHYKHYGLQFKPKES